MQLVTRSTQPAYRVIVGARNVSAARAAFDALPDGKGREPAVTVLPLELADLRNVKTFAREALEVVGKVGESSTPRVDYLLLNAAITNAANDNPNKIPGKWCEAFVVNHLAQHYLVHLLRDTLVESGTRIVFVSSGAVRYVSDPSTILPS